MHVPIRQWAVRALCLFILPLFCIAQRYTFKEYVEGLGNLNVNCMLQDRTGFLWIGTENGLFRYDGSRFQDFGHRDGLANTFINALHEDTSGRLWVGTTDGLFYLQATGRFANVQYEEHNLVPQRGSSLSSWRDGTVFVATDLGPLVITSPDGGQTWRCRLLLSQENSKLLVPNGTKAVLANADGSILFGCGDGLCQMSPNQLTKWGTEEGLPRDIWTSFLRDSRGQLWVRGPSHIAVLPLGQTRFECRDVPHRPRTSEYLSLSEDLGGHVLATIERGVARYENGNWRILGQANGLSEYPVESILVDREGLTWLGLAGHGLQKWFAYGGWEHWTSADGLQSNVVWAILRDHRGRLWIGDDSGVSFMEPGSLKLRLWNARGIQTGHNRSIAESKDGFIWIGTSDGRLIQVDSSTLRGRQFTLRHIHRIFVDSRDRVWVATRFRK